MSKPGREHLTAWVQSLKKDQPCVDCGECYDPVVMHFDHVKGIKRGSISQLVRRGSKAAILEEIRKCELRCANCHALKHFG